MAPALPAASGNNSRATKTARSRAMGLTWRSLDLGFAVLDVLLGDRVVFLLDHLLGLRARILLGHVIVAGIGARDELDLQRNGFGHGTLGFLAAAAVGREPSAEADRKSTRLNSSHSSISYAVFCLKK